MKAIRTSRRWALRDATGASHRRLDDGMSAFDLTDRVDYARFLRVMYESIRAMECELEAFGIQTVLPDWSARRRRHALREDVAGMKMPAASRGTPPKLPIDGRAAALGIVYVLEGSRLGSQILLQQALNGPDALIRRNTRFLAHGDVATMWPSFLHVLDAELRCDADLAGAKAGALDAFELCRRVLDVVTAKPAREMEIVE